jgi:osmotically-inducible protein OsmY
MINIIKKHHKILLVVLAIIIIFLMIFLLSSPADAFYQTDPQDKTEIIAEKVQANLSEIPEYGVFDWISFKLESDGKVLLKGWVVFKETKTEAYKAIKKIPEIKEIDDQIQVLPDSRIDNKIRNTAWEKIEKIPELEKYADGENPKVHIIVDKARVSLFGTVNNKSEAELFAVILSAIPDVLSVQDNLQVLPQKK